MNSVASSLKGRWVTLVAFAFILSVLLFAKLAGAHDWRAAWHVLGVPAMQPSFADLRTVTHSIDAVRNGYDPYVQTDFDPWRRVYNYPRIWLNLKYTGVGAGNTVPIGALMVALLVAAFTLIFECRTWKTAGIAFGILVSPPVLLCVERGNIDIFIFSFLTIGFTLTRSCSLVVRVVARSCLIAFLTVLKIYPFAASAALIRNRGSVVVAGIVAVLSILLLRVSLHHGDLERIALNTPQNASLSYGSLPLFLDLGDKLGFADKAMLRLVAAVSALAVLLVAAGISLFRPAVVRFLPQLLPGTATADIGVAFLAIYIFSFVIGSNFDYRLIFLAGVTAPILRTYDQIRVLPYLLYPAAVLIFLWISRVSVLIGVTAELVDWGIFAASSTIFVTYLVQKLGLVVPSRAHAIGSGA